jgi:hypothetical protein
MRYCHCRTRYRSDPGANLEPLALLRVLQHCSLPHDPNSGRAGSSNDQICVSGQSLTNRSTFADVRNPDPKQTRRGRFFGF